MLTETTILYILVWSLVVFGLVIAYKLFGEKVYKTKYRRLLGEYGQLNSRIKKANKAGNAPAANAPGAPGNLNEFAAQMASMTYEQAAQEMGVKEEDYNNPIFRPMLEQYFEHFKAKLTQGGGSFQEEESGY